MKNRFAYWGRAIMLCLMDSLFLNIALLFSGLFYTYFLKTDSRILSIYLESTLLITAGSFVIFLIMGVHKILWRFLSLGNLFRLLFAVFFASFWSYCALRIVNGYWQSPIIGVTTFYLFLSMSIGVRLIPSVYDLVRRKMMHRSLRTGRLPLLIVGAGEGADALIKDIENHSSNKYRIVGLIDDDPKKRGHSLRGVRILGGTDDLPELVRKHGIQEIIIAIPSATTDERQRLIAATMSTGCKVRSMLHVSELAEPTVADLHDLDIGDLLGRQEVYLNPQVMATYITGSAVLVTGGGGSIGSELCRQIMRFEPKELVIFDIYENNAYDLAQELKILYGERAQHVHVRVGSVQNRQRLNEVFDEFCPEVVFHAAAYKHVPLMEECPALAIENNVFGTHNVAQVAIAHKVRRFVMISTDKAVNPTNIMGASKRLAELIIQSLNGQGTEFVAVRFGNVLGSNGSVVPLFRKQIERGGPVTVTHPEVIRYFMTIPEAARLVLQAGALARGGETFVLDMGDPVKIDDLARTMIEMAGLKPDVDIEVQYTGLRPGEKLYEELLLSGEDSQKAVSDKIYVAHSEAISNKERREILETLHACVNKNDDVQRCVMELLPSYHAENEGAPLLTM